MRSVIFGVLFILGGLSGAMVLRGTGSSGALVVVGIIFVVLGIAKSAAQGGDLGGGKSEADLERDEEMLDEYRRATAMSATSEAAEPRPAPEPRRRVRRLTSSRT